MTLLRLASRNLLNNFRSYFLYFASMVFSVLIYFMFVSLKYDTTIQQQVSGSLKIGSAFNGASIVLIIFVAIFIWYSNSFFTRKRKKEVGMYSLLGVSKKQIGWMLFYENFMMGVLALAVGIIMGAFLSKFFVMLLMKVMGYEAIGHFVLSAPAVINTGIVFLILILLTSLHGYRLIYRFRLIELFQADQRGELAPRASLLLALLSLIMIGTGYGLSLQNYMESVIWRQLGFVMTPMLILVLVISGTYLLFNTLTVYLLGLMRSRKSYFWRGIHLVSISQLLYRIRGNAMILTVITVLSATTLTAGGMAYSLYYQNEKSILLSDPNSLMFLSGGDAADTKIERLIHESRGVDVRYHEKLSALEMTVDMSSIPSAITGSKQVFTVIPVSSYNQLADWQGNKEKLNLRGEEAVVLDAGYSQQFSPAYQGASLHLHAGKVTRNIHVIQLCPYNVLNSGIAGTVIVLPDEAFTILAAQTTPVPMQIYGLDGGRQEARQLADTLKQHLSESSHLSSQAEDYSAGMQVFGVLIFMSGFLGLVFLAATGSILYFKQLTEAHAEVDRYAVLLKIGVKRSEIRKSVYQQMLFIFGLPLIGGMAHCVVALTGIFRLMSANIAVPVTICMVVYGILYLVYYLFTGHQYYRIVTQSATH
ncbi:FtsX-like permease family protein [Paenibacillus dauci]|uniref:FtsX-like permease family protein n=1 Tax=Paenibacillus dauci TaxID=1567106 RepID=UPI000619633C|nr:ABC transporter permease [Paenibacillus dauci]